MTHPSFSCINLASHLHYSLVLTFTPTSTSSQTEPGESVIFQPVLQAYPTRHSWIITTHISLGNFECHWKLFSRQITWTQWFLRSLEQHPSASTQLPTTLQLELSNIQDIYKSNEATILSAINLLNSNQLQPITRCKRSLLPFLGTALSWLTGTATTKDISSIKARINQLIATQSLQCDTLVHIVYILNITRYATQVNRHSINKLIYAVHTASQDIDNLYNVTTSLASSISFNQMILHIRSVFANLCDSIHYLHTLSTQPRITSMLPLQEYFHHMYYLLQICRKCYNTLWTPYLQPYTYQYHHWTPYTSINTYVHMSW